MVSQSQNTLFFSFNRTMKHAGRGDKQPEPELIAYPGYDFLPTEEADRESSLGKGVRLISYELLADALTNLPRRSRGGWKQLRDAIAPKPKNGRSRLAHWLCVALSAGDSDDLAALGYDAQSGSVHVSAAVLRCCRALLLGKVRIAYGGALRDGKSFASLLHDLIASMSAQIDVAADADPVTPLENYVIAPHVPQNVL